MAWTPNYRLPRQKCYRASFVRTFRAERMQLITRLQNQHPLPTYRNDNELVLLEFGGFIACQTRWPGRACLRQRFKITNDWISNTHEPTEEACAQKNVKEMAARRWWRSRVACHTADDHEQFRPTGLRIFSENPAAPDNSSIGDFLPGRKIGSSFCSVLRPAFVMTNTCEFQLRLCGYRAQHAQQDPDRGQDHRQQTPRVRWSFDFRPRSHRSIC